MKCIFVVTSMVQIIFLFCVSNAHSQSARGKASEGIKLVCAWSIEGKSPAEVDSVVELAQQLGFNAVSWNRESLVASCHKRGMKAMALVNPLEAREGALLQQLALGEEDLPGSGRSGIPPESFYQYGGEPVPGNREILDHNLACPDDPGIVAYTMERVAELERQGYDAVIFDFVGYRNYHSCECRFCREKLASFRRAHPQLHQRQAAEAFYENQLVELYDTLYVAAKALAPGMIIANHIHPVFLPNLWYGHKLRVDYCGVTVSWFFKPHWPLDKVREYARRVVQGPYRHNFAVGMPMIGFYADTPYARDRKSARRLKQELAIIKEAGAGDLIMCELGHILRHKEASAAVREALAGIQ